MTGMDMPVEPVDILGYAAALMVFITFCMKTMIWLRIAAAASNIAFIGYGIGADLYPILILHVVLLPMNLFRLWENLVLARRIRKATREDPTVQMLLPFMRPLDVKSGEVVFRKGDEADRLFYVQKGTISIEEFDKFIEAGDVFGEIGLFSRNQSRTATARAVGDVELCEIDRETVLRIYQEHPEFGLILARLVTDRLVENQTNLLKRLSAATSEQTGR